jgi:hypothetical protein
MGFFFFPEKNVNLGKSKINESGAGFPYLGIRKVHVPELDVALHCRERHSRRVFGVDFGLPVQNAKDGGDREARLVDVGAHRSGLGDADGAQNDRKEYLPKEKKSEIGGVWCSER